MVEGEGVYLKVLVLVRVRVRLRMRMRVMERFQERVHQGLQVTGVSRVRCCA
jgi:hypothetical protein